MYKKVVFSLELRYRSKIVLSMLIYKSLLSIVTIDVSYFWKVGYLRDKMFMFD